MRFVVVVITFVFFQTHALASQCTPQTAQVIAEAAQVAFVGTVAKVEESAYKPRRSLEWAPQPCAKLVTFQVTERLRGRVAPTATVISADACLGLGHAWVVGAQYLVVAERNVSYDAGEFVGANGCWGTVELGKDRQAEAQGIISAIKASKR